MASFLFFKYSKTIRSSVDVSIGSARDFIFFFQFLHVLFFSSFFDCHSYLNLHYSLHNLSSYITKVYFEYCYYYYYFIVCSFLLKLPSELAINCQFHYIMSYSNPSTKPKTCLAQSTQIRLMSDVCKCKVAPEKQPRVSYNMLHACKDIYRSFWEKSRNFSVQFPLSV